VVLRFEGEELTVVSWEPPPPPDPEQLVIAAACLQWPRGYDPQAEFTLVIAGDGYYDSASLEVEADILVGEERDDVVFSEAFDHDAVAADFDREGVVHLTFNPLGIDYAQDWVHLTVTAATLTTLDSDGQPTDTDVLAGLLAALGQQPEVDLLDGAILGGDLPAGEYQVHNQAHEQAPEVILGACAPTYWL
jgi:hypothetical protein